MPRPSISTRMAGARWSSPRPTPSPRSGGVWWGGWFGPPPAPSRALDDEGDRLWSAHEPMTLTTFVTGDLYRKHTKQAVALWHGERTARLAVYDAEGNVSGA